MLMIKLLWTQHELCWIQLTCYVHVMHWHCGKATEIELQEHSFSLRLKMMYHKKDHTIKGMIVDGSGP